MLVSVTVFTRVHVDACVKFCAALCSHELFTFLQLCACSGVSVGLTDQDLVRFKAIIY